MLRGLKSLFELLFTDYSTKQNNQLRLRIHALLFPLFINTPSLFIFLFFPLEGHAVLKLFNSPTGSTKLLAADEKFLFRFIVRARTWETGQREDPFRVSPLRLVAMRASSLEKPFSQSALGNAPVRRNFRSLKETRHRRQPDTRIRNCPSSNGRNERRDLDFVETRRYWRFETFANVQQGDRRSRRTCDSQVTRPSGND